MSTSMIPEIQIYRKLDTFRVLNLCVQRHLYTIGSETDYRAMFNRASATRTDDDIIHVGVDIWEHSDIVSCKKLGYYFMNLLYDLFNFCTVTELSCKEEGWCPPDD